MSSFCCSLNLRVMSENAKRRNLLTKKISGRIYFWGTYARNMQNKKNKIGIHHILAPLLFSKVTTDPSGFEATGRLQ